MPSRNSKESITFLVNIGTIKHGTPSSSQLLDKEKYILKHIIQKKIFLRPKDEIGVILMGSDSGKSDSITGLDYAQELCSMQAGNWDLIRSIEKLQTTNHTCSWMEAIYAAVEYIKHECVDNSKRKIILLSAFNEEEDVVDQFQAENIAETLRSEEISLLAIGERTLHDIAEDSQTASEALLMKVLKVLKIDGQYFTFERAMSDVRFYKRPSTKPRLWRCRMELGDFCIPIAGISQLRHKKLTEVKLPKMALMAKTSTSDQEVPITYVAQWMDNNRTTHREEDIIRGYVYGGKVIPVSDKAKKAMTPKDNKQCYKIHGFTAREKIPMEYWLSDGSYVIVPANEEASIPFYSLVQAMVEKNVVAIVEKVCRANTEANMVALFPSVDVPNEPWCLIEIGLSFEQDYGAIAQRPLKFRLSEEQDDAMDELLTSLELPDVADDDATNGSEKYLPGYMPDAGTQHMWDMLAARALNSDKPLPRIADDVLSLLEQPEFVRESCESATEKIKNLFFLEKKKSLRKRKRSQEEDDKQSDANNDAPMTQTVKEEERDTVKGNNDKSKNNDLSDDECDFNFDDVADI